MSALALLLLSLLSVGFSWQMGVEVSHSEPPRSRWIDRVDRHLRVVARAELLNPQAEAGPELARTAMIGELARARAAMAVSPSKAGGLLRALYQDRPSGDVEDRVIASLVEIAQADWPAGYRRDFLVDLAPAAIRSGRERQIPPSVTLAQAVIESGWGRSKLTRQHHNLFGVKGGSGKNGVRVSSRVSGQGKRAKFARMTFRTYPNFEASIAHHGELLSTASAYAKARPHWADWRVYLEIIGPKYASDRRYVAVVSAMITRYRLDQWDHMVVLAVEQDRRSSKS